MSKTGISVCWNLETWPLEEVTRSMAAFWSVGGRGGVLRSQRAAMYAFGWQPLPRPTRIEQAANAAPARRLVLSIVRPT